MGRPLCTDACSRLAQCTASPDSERKSAMRSRASPFTHHARLPLPSGSPDFMRIAVAPLLLKLSDFRLTFSCGSLPALKPDSICDHHRYAQRSRSFHTSSDVQTKTDVALQLSRRRGRTATTSAAYTFSRHLPAMRMAFTVAGHQFSTGITWIYELLAFRHWGRKRCPTTGVCPSQYKQNVAPPETTPKWF